jgi:hypothetical protein
MLRIGDRRGSKSMLIIEQHTGDEAGRGHAQRDSAVAAYFHSFHWDRLAGSYFAVPGAGASGPPDSIVHPTSAYNAAIILPDNTNSPHLMHWRWG